MRARLPTLTLDASGATLRVHVKPRASKSRVLEPKEGVLEVALAAPPVDGAANEELVRVLAAHFDVPKRSVSIVSGHTSRHKLVRLGVVPRRIE
jgi:uncharacterized protein (TIGR00251 family)